MRSLSLHIPNKSSPFAQAANNLPVVYTATTSVISQNGVTVRISINTRKFRCRNELCRQQVFCERLPNLIETYASKTCRLNAALIWLAFDLGGEAGARTAQRLRMKTSGDTLLRMIRRVATTQKSSPSLVNEPGIVGVDDWAWRKGCTYGTIIVDLARRKVIDLLPDREAGTLTNWLLKRPGIKTVARDRSPTYQKGITMGRPYATQVTGGICPAI